MQEIIRNVRDIDNADRAALEHVAGRELRENQQLIISVVNLDVTAHPPVQSSAAAAGLPDWCNVYEGLTDEEVDDIEKSIVRSPGGRSFE